MFFERHAGGERAVLVDVNFRINAQLNADLGELKELTTSAAAVVVAVMAVGRDKPDKKYFIGAGKVDEIAQMVTEHGGDIVIFNHDLSPGQERNLEYALKCRVIDRTRLILDIFAQRARSHAGKLQVELAQLQYMSTRLVRGWTHLERQKGGIGMRGPGETQLEMDKRMIRGRIKQIRSKLDKVHQQRELGRSARKHSDTPTVSIVGYTNAGKSSVFNRLTASQVVQADQLFATLDPTLRQVSLPHLGPAIVADTVGFIRNLPHDLVESFKATLEETVHADLILHVIDASDPNHQEYIEQTLQVLSHIKADTKPMLTVMNKIDLCASGIEPHIAYNQDGSIDKVWVCALTGAGFDQLLQALTESLTGTFFEGSIVLPGDYGRLRAKLYQLGAVTAESYDNDGNWVLTLKCQTTALNRLLHSCGIDPDFWQKLLRQNKQ